MSDLPSAGTYHGMFAHVHGTGKGYFAHGGDWTELLDENTSILMEVLLIRDKRSNALELVYKSKESLSLQKVIP